MAISGAYSDEMSILNCKEKWPRYTQTQCAHDDAKNSGDPRRRGRRVTVVMLIRVTQTISGYDAFDYAFLATLGLLRDINAGPCVLYHAVYTLRNIFLMPRIIIAMMIAANETLLVRTRSKYVFTKEPVRTLERDGGEGGEDACRWLTPLARPSVTINTDVRVFPRTSH